jgi:hypothetical protein
MRQRTLIAARKPAEPPTTTQLRAYSYANQRPVTAVAADIIRPPVMHARPERNMTVRELAAAGTPIREIATILKHSECREGNHVRHELIGLVCLDSRRDQT